MLNGCLAGTSPRSRRVLRISGWAAGLIDESFMSLSDSPKAVIVDEKREVHQRLDLSLARGDAGAELLMGGRSRRRARRWV